MRIASITLGLIFFVAAGCAERDDGSDNAPASYEEMEQDAGGAEREAVFDAPTTQPEDVFTYSNYNAVRVTNADFDLTADFDAKTFSGSVVLDIEYLETGTETLILDTDDLTIERVEGWTGDSWGEVSYSLGDDDPMLGAPLEVSLEEKPDRIRVIYATDPNAQGLQWLSPEQTAGKVHPYLFSQFQALHARSFAPLQDTPAVRMTYSARIQTPPELLAVMSAEQDPDGLRDGDYSFRMPQPIPSYLIAIAIGDIEFKAINDTIGVYAEEYILEASAVEFEDTPLMEDTIEKLYGPYLWGRYDLIVLPPSFPFGGMENPRLSFLTPTLIAGDKSLTNVVAHELAHSWSGNLVTNATWRDAWMNEGFTSYVENRVMEDLYGVERASMERYLDLQSLKRDVAEATDPALTSLKMPEDLASTDDAFTQVSYAGGMFFLKFLEDRFGRADFDQFLKSYFDEFAFQSIVTEDFLAYFEDKLWAANTDAVTRAEIEAWIYEPGLPEANTFSTLRADGFEVISELTAEWTDYETSDPGVTFSEWSTHEWLHFIAELPDDLTPQSMAALDARLSLTGHQNAEIAYAWYMRAIAVGYEPAMPALEEFLLRVGRGKFIYRLYQALVDHGRAEWASDVYERARPGYHPIAQRRIDTIFEEAGASAPDGESKSLEEMRAESRAKIDEEDCIAGGGAVVQDGLLGLYRCTTPYGDAGKLCSDASDCEGRCMGDDTVTDYDAPTGEVVGKCEVNDSPFGCFALVENGSVGPALCVD